MEALPHICMDPYIQKNEIKMQFILTDPTQFNSYFSNHQSNLGQKNLLLFPVELHTTFPFP